MRYLRVAQAYMLISIPTLTSETLGARHAQAYMLISMPTLTSATFGAFQDITSSIADRGTIAATDDDQYAVRRRELIHQCHRKS